MNVLKICIYFALISCSFGKRGGTGGKVVKPPTQKQATTRKRTTTRTTTTKRTSTTPHTGTTDTTEAKDSEEEEITTPEMPEEETELFPDDAVNIQESFFNRESASCYSEALHQLQKAAFNVLIALAEECPGPIEEGKSFKDAANGILRAARAADAPCKMPSLGMAIVYTSGCFVQATIAMVKLIWTVNKISTELIFEPYGRDPDNFQCIERQLTHLQCKISLLQMEILYCTLKFASDAFDFKNSMKSIIKSKKSNAQKIPEVIDVVQGDS